MNKNCEPIIEYQKQRSLKKRDKVIAVIEQLKEYNEIINFNSVAKKANVSRKFIYSQAELVEMINKLKPASIERNKKKILSLKASSKSNDAKLKALTFKCKALQQENCDLKNEIMVLRQHIESLNAS